MADRSYLSIGEVLSLLQPEFEDLTISKIRFLESQGLLEPERTPSGYRKFYENDVERLRWILRQQREQYLPLKVIRGKLGDPEDDDDEVAALAPVAVAPGVAEDPSTASRRGARVDPGEPPADAGTALRSVAPVPVSAAPAGDDAGAHAGVPAARGAPADTADDANPLAPARTGVSLTATEICAAANLDAGALADLEKFGLVSSRMSGSTAYYDEEALAVAQLAAGFMAHGVEARHLRMYKTAAEREAGLFEQLVMPLLRQRNPRARREAMERLNEIARLGQELRAAMLRLALRDELG